MAFALAEFRSGDGWAEAGIIKDAGDDPDVTHGAMILARVRRGAPGSGVTFRAGPGVGIVTRPGLPIPPGEPAINPVPRRMMTEALIAIAACCDTPADFEVEISVPGGEALALRTWNPRLGIEGGLSILGTTGIVRPFSCAAWIASIHRGIDVARASGLAHAIGSTGATSEHAAQQHCGLPDHAMLDMGDFAGGMLKYLRRHPIPRVTIAGGFGKLAKLAQGALDLHSARSQVDFTRLAERAGDLIPANLRGTACNSAMQVLEIAGAGAGGTDCRRCLVHGPGGSRRRSDRSRCHGRGSQRPDPRDRRPGRCPFAMNGQRRVLVLGGTGEARSFCSALAQMHGIAAIVSLAGVTRNPVSYDVPTRKGGFGGVEGLALYLDENRIDALVDATHPFAVSIGQNAAAAARTTGRPHLKLLRPAWRPAANETWRSVPDFAAAAKALPPKARAFLATGPGSVPHFRDLGHADVVLRVIGSCASQPLPQDWTILTARPPYSVASEIATFRRHGITHLVTRNAGGDEGRAKLDAAAALGLDVIVIARPEPPAGIATVATVAEALAWLRGVDPESRNPA